MPGKKEELNLALPDLKIAWGMLFTAREELEYVHELMIKVAHMLVPNYFVVKYTNSSIPLENCMHRQTHQIVVTFLRRNNFLIKGQK